MLYLILVLCGIRLAVCITTAMLRAMKRDVNRIRENCLPYREEDYQESAGEVQEEHACHECHKVIYDVKVEQEKQQEKARKERERIMRQREQERKREQSRELAQMDYEHYTHELERINAECKALEKELAEETAEAIRTKLDRKVNALNEKAYQLNRKKAVAFYKMK